MCGKTNKQKTKLIWRKYHVAKQKLFLRTRIFWNNIYYTKFKMNNQKPIRKCTSIDIYVIANAREVTHIKLIKAEAEQNY